VRVVFRGPRARPTAAVTASSTVGRGTGTDGGTTVGGSRRVQRVMPAAVLAAVVLADLLTGRGQSLIGLLTMPPLLAATALGRRATVGYGLLALLAAALIGVYDGQ
jgi:hypothetical protein